MPQSSDYTRISLYKSETADAVPSPSALSVGELAVNVADRKLFTKNSSEAIVEITNGSDHTHLSEDITDLTEAVNIILNASTLEANRPTITTQAGTTYTIDSDDETSIIRFTNSSAVTVTVPANATDPLEIGYIVHLHQEGTGELTVAASGGVTINSSSSLVARNRYAALSLMKMDTDTWVLVGDQS